MTLLFGVTSAIPTKAVEEVAEAVMKEGPFALGALFGCVITLVIMHFCGKERIVRQKLENEHVKELQKQLRIRDERINELHVQLGKKKS